VPFGLVEGAGAAPWEEDEATRRVGDGLVG
jgi:hypothetical protein